MLNLTSCRRGKAHRDAVFRESGEKEIKKIKKYPKKLDKQIPMC